ncbi:hypothetical protein WN51_02440 [Melipona quadrifasciata]|uniref:Uncharacterized protein n=1 Tax=Melipona quadrifasciata TaxID=166423 RepID=A0A0M8ZXG6_9HYME|nr:hypothetical protein WN51_02440 [Melipona quadrifasciata]
MKGYTLRNLYEPHDVSESTEVYILFTGNAVLVHALEYFCDVRNRDEQAESFAAFCSLYGKLRIASHGQSLITVDPAGQTRTGPQRRHSSRRNRDVRIWREKNNEFRQVKRNGLEMMIRTNESRQLQATLLCDYNFYASKFYSYSIAPLYCAERIRAFPQRFIFQQLVGDMIDVFL